MVASPPSPMSPSGLAPARPEADFLARLPRRASFYLLWSVTALLGGSIAWAYLSKVDLVVSGSAILVPLGDPVRVEAALGGEVRDLRAVEGRDAEQGEFLLAIDSGQVRSERSSFLVATERVQRARAELESDFPLRDRSWEEEMSSRRSSIARLRELVEGKRAAHGLEEGLAAKEVREKEHELARTRIELEQAETEVRIAQSQLEIATGEHERNIRLQEKELVSAVELAETRAGLLEAESRLDQARKNVLSICEGIGGTEVEISRLRGAGELRSQKVENEIRELESRIAEFESGISRITLERDREGSRVQQSLAEAKAALAAEELSRHPAASDGQFEVRAPVKGTVTRLVVKREGEVVAPGDLLVEIAPAGAPLIARVLVPNQDIARIREGMAVKLKYPAYPFQDHGIQEGRVLRISSDAIPDEKLGHAYEVQVELAKQTILVDGVEEPLRLGLAAEAQLVVGRKSMLELLLDPLEDLRERGQNVRP